MNAMTDSGIRSQPIESDVSAVSWGAIIAGGTASAALTIVLLAFGAGVGFSVVSPWPDAGVSAASFTIGAGLYLLVVAMLAASIGGYVAGRLRTKWTGVPTDEVYFRDTAHGLLAWAFATLLGMSVLAAIATQLAAGLSASPMRAAGIAATQVDAALDRLLRPASSNAPRADARTADDVRDMRGELGRLISPGLVAGAEFPAAERGYIAQIVEMRTGLPLADAERRTTEIITSIKATADDARRAARNFALWLCASLLLGAFSASLAATEGGGLRDGTWIGARRRAA